MADDENQVASVTSASFEGLIAVNDMQVSWVRTWQQLPATYVRGCYAVSVNGQLPRHVIAHLRRGNAPLISRNRQHDVAAVPPPSARDRDHHHQQQQPVASSAAPTVLSGIEAADAALVAGAVDEDVFGPM